jgi:hypothetical protein
VTEMLANSGFDVGDGIMVNECPGDQAMPAIGNVCSLDNTDVVKHWTMPSHNVNIALSAKLRMDVPEGSGGIALAGKGEATVLRDYSALELTVEPGRRSYRRGCTDEWLRVRNALGNGAGFLHPMLSQFEFREGIHPGGGAPLGAKR